MLPKFLATDGVSNRSGAPLFEPVIEGGEDSFNNPEQKRRAETEQRPSVQRFNCTREVPPVFEAKVGVPVAGHGVQRVGE